MFGFEYMRAVSFQQSRTWLSGALMLVIFKMTYGGDFNLTLSRDLLIALFTSFISLLIALPTQIHYSQSYLSRATWLASSFAAVWMAYDIYPFYAEAVPHDIFMRRAGEFAYFNPENTSSWASVSIGVYIVLSLLIFMNAVLAAYLSVSRIVDEVRYGDRLPNKKLGSAETKLQLRADLSTRDAEAVPARITFNDLAGQEELKAKLWDAAQTWNNGGSKDGKNGILLYGVPGTGKTAFAEALAGEVGLKIMKVNIGSIASRYINQTTEQLQEIIDSALHQAPCVLFLDEVESIFPDRSLIDSGNSEETKMVGSFLSSIEKLRAGRVLVIAATNYKDRVDAAAIREGRFDFHIEVTVPDFEARKGLVLAALKNTGKTVEPAVLDRLARRWAGFNVPRIQEATRRAAGFATTNVVDMAEFMKGLRDVQGNNSGLPENALGLDELYFDDDLKDRLKNLAANFAMSDKIEAKGGNIPKGVIFYGPPGTGKSAMAMALAKASGWTFIATSGKEILSDDKKLREIRQKASDLRPSIVFIDEADDILGDRQLSGMKLYTNELLATIDGATGPLHDVVWIVATNHINSMDEAVTRRFPVKIELPAPSIKTLTRMVRDWAANNTHAIQEDVDEWSAKIAAALEGLAPSLVKGILETALNNEITNSVLRETPMNITLEEVLAARREMRA